MRGRRRPPGVLLLLALSASLVLGLGALAAVAIRVVGEGMPALG